jgi:hypothetical protein
MISQHDIFSDKMDLEFAQSGNEIAQNPDGSQKTKRKRIK